MPSGVPNGFNATNGLDEATVLNSFTDEQIEYLRWRFSGVVTTVQESIEKVNFAAGRASVVVELETRVLDIRKRATRVKQTTLRR